MQKNRKLHVAFLCGVIALVVLAFVFATGVRRTENAPEKAPIHQPR